MRARDASLGRAFAVAAEKAGVMRARGWRVDAGASLRAGGEQRGMRRATPGDLEGNKQSRACRPAMR